MTSTAVVRPPTGVPPASCLARALGFFSGTVGLVIKLVFLGVMNALALWAVGVLLTDGKWISGLLIAAATAAIDLVYLGPWHGTSRSSSSSRARCS